MKDSTHTNTISCDGETLQLQMQERRTFFRGFVITCVMVCLLVMVSGFRPLQEPDYAVHANIIYHFTKYIDWPEDNKKGDFIIGVTGKNILFEKLNKIVTVKKVGNQRIVVKKIPVDSKSFNCHILFVGAEESKWLKKIAAGTAGSPVLIVSESEGLAQKGSCINFVIVNDRLKLEINKRNIENRHLSIASELLQLGILIN